MCGNLKYRKNIQQKGLLHYHLQTLVWYREEFDKAKTDLLKGV